MVSRDGWVALPRGATGLSAVCDCGISRSYSLTIFARKSYILGIFQMGGPEPLLTSLDGLMIHKYFTKADMPKMTEEGKD